MQQFKCYINGMSDNTSMVSAVGSLANENKVVKFFDCGLVLLAHTLVKRPDVIVTTCRSNGLSGILVAERLRTDGYTEGIGIVGEGERLESYCKLLGVTFFPIHPAVSDILTFIQKAGEK